MTGTRLPRTVALLVALAVTPFPASGSQQSDPPLHGRVQEALDLLQQGEQERAEALLREIVERAPRHGPARFQLGRLALARGEPEAALEHLEIAVTAELQRAYLAWSLLGRAQLALGDAEAAAVSFERTLASAPRFGPGLLGHARAKLFLDRPEEALRDLATALALPGATSETALLAAQLLVYLGQTEDVPRLLAMLEDHPDAGGEEAVAATMLAAAREPGEDAATRLRVLLGRNLSLADAYVALGVHRWLNDLDDLATPFRIALEIDDRHAIARLFLHAVDSTAEPPEPQPIVRARFTTALSHYEEGRIGEAGRIAERLLEDRPHHVPAVMLAVRAAEDRGDLWTALSGYRRLLEWLPGLPALQSRLADVAHAMGAEDLAEASVRAALAAFPDDGALHYRLATILVSRQATEGGLEAALRAIELGFDAPEVWLILGQLHLARMETAPAIEAYRRALEIAPDAAEFLGTFALSSLTTEEFSSLRQLLERHAAAHPNNVDTLYNLGVMSLRDGQLEQAAAHLEQAALTAPERSDVQYNLAQTYRRLGRVDDARAAMDRFTELEARENEIWERQNRLHFLRVQASDASAGGDPARAVDLWREINADPLSSLDDLRSLGQALLETGQASEAVDRFQTVLETRPYDRQAVVGLAAAAAAAGRESLAQLAHRRVALLSAGGQP